MAIKGYNATDLSPDASFERHVYHRDQFAHFLRWTHILKVAKVGERIVDFGCGQGNLLEVLYRNRFKPEYYAGLDIREQTVRKAKEKFAACKFTNEWFVQDLVHPTADLSYFKANIVCSFEVLEHVGKSNGKVFLQNFMACGAHDATYYLSTPNYDERVGAADNHTYDALDGLGKIPQEWGYDELEQLLKDCGFAIEKTFGTFASQRDYEPHLTDAQREVYEQLKQYYDSNLVSNLMAPIVDARYARNTLWVLKRAT